MLSVPPLVSTTSAALLPSVNLLATDPFDWKLLRFNAASLNDHLRNRFLDGLFILPGRKILQRQLNLEPDLTMPAAAACAGFWQLSRRQLPEAVAAFACVRGLPFGECLYQSVLALQAGQAITEWTAISPWAGRSGSPSAREGLDGQARSICFAMQSAPLGRGGNWPRRGHCPSGPFMGRLPSEKAGRSDPPRRGP